jgi:farnesyl diphosphate synthase
MRELLENQRSRFERDFFLRLKKTSLKSAPPRLHEATLYALSGANKRIRPVLALETATLANLQNDRAFAIAAAFECVHSYSLVHDDLPAMDNDDMRRGQPSCHKKYGEATAILVGDLLQGLAFELLTLAKLQPVAINYFARAIAAQGMVSGQHLDMENHTTSVRRLHRLKTGRLIEAALNLPLLTAKGSLTLATVRWGRGLGMLFQITDDIIDATSDSATLGKTAGKDAEQNKKTFVRELGLAQAKLAAEKLAMQLANSARVLFAASPLLQQLPAFLLARKT